VLKLIIEDDEGRKTVVPFVRDEITIGRQEGNTIRLTERNVSRRHARLVRLNGHVVVEDLGSYNGVLINGERIQGQTEIRDGDLIQIGDYDLALQNEAALQATTAPTIRLPSVNPEGEEGAEAEPPLEAPPLGLDTSPTQEFAHAHSEEQPTPVPAAPVLDTRRNSSTAVIRTDAVDRNRTRKLETLEPEDAPRLLVVSAEFKGQEFACIRTEMRVGRTDDNDISLDHRSLSRTHAKIVRENSGEWRIIDMQSANGLTVNGESYAQATLNHGDLIELGHVKLRFVGAGQSAKGLEHEGTKRGSKKPLMLALVGLVLLGAGAGVALMLFGQSGPTPTPKPPVVVTPPSQQQQETPPPDTQPAPGVPAHTEQLQGARDALAANDFSKAVQVLESLRDGSGALPADAEELLTQARTEQQARQSLDLAEKELTASRPQEAQKYLEASAATQAFAQEHAALSTRVQEALAEATRPTPPKPPDRKLPTPPAPERPAKNEQEIQAIISDSAALMKKKQFREAEGLLRKCLELDPVNAECNVMLGSTYAKLNRLDEGARHYRQFLELAPNDSRAPRVKQMVDDYEKKKAASTNP
jgi:pSer/pThr/pTyr-binding forkhead associated (FHA) protein